MSNRSFFTFCSAAVELAPKCLHLWLLLVDAIHFVTAMGDQLQLLAQLLPSESLERGPIHMPVIYVIGTAIPFLVVCLRMYARLSRRAASWDDYLICIAEVCLASREFTS